MISNYLREVRVPWREIVDVSGSRWVNTRQIKVTFNRDIGFGTSIIFMPKVRLLWPGQESPIAQELRDLVLENREPAMSGAPAKRFAIPLTSFHSPTQIFTLS